MRYILAAALLVLPFAAQAEGMYDKRVVSIVGEAETKVMPNRVQVGTTAHTEGKDLAKVKQENDRKLRKIVEIALKNGVTKDNIKTLHANVQPKYYYDQKTSKQHQDGYIVSNAVELTLDKPENLGNLMQDLVSAGIDRTDYVNFTLIDDKPVRERTLLAAIAHARAKAEKVAATLGDKLGQALVIQETGSNFMPPPMPMMRAMKMEAAVASDMAQAPPSGLIRVQQNVNVTFELRD